MLFDVEQLRLSTNLADLAATLGVRVEKDGEEFVGCCPFHREKDASFSIFRGDDGVQRFHCFGCGAHGDAIEFVQRIKDVGFREACDILGGKETRRPNVTPRADVQVRDIYAGLIPEAPPADLLRVGAKVKLYNPKRADTSMAWGTFVPSHVHPYRDASGDLIGYVLRRSLPDGGKETPMVMRVRGPGGGRAWSRYPFPKPRPLYGLHLLAEASQVIIVEGEKCADRGNSKTGRTFISWAGGTQGVKWADWTPLAGKDVIIWPDADAPGLTSRNEIASILAGLDCRVRVVDVSDQSEGWDIADAFDKDGWDEDKVDDFIRERIVAWASPDEIKAADAAVGETVSTGPAEEETPPPPAQGEKADNVVELRPGQQEKPKQKKKQKSPATVTDISTREVFDVGNAWRRDLVPDDEGYTKKTSINNFALFLEHHDEMKGVFRYNEFTNNAMVYARPPWSADGEWKPRPVSDHDYVEALIWLERRKPEYFAPKPNLVVPVVNLVCAHNSFDPLRDYLEGLEWDGCPRVDGWLTYYAGAEHKPYTNVVGRRFLISAVARALSPGKKVDTMLILEGKQGKGKSTAVRALFGPDFFTDEISDIGSKDASQEMQGVWCVEIAEMDKFNTASINQVKKFLSKQEDRYRPPYGKTVVRAPRRTVFVGTMNPDGVAYLRDQTGARRFWPVTIGDKIAVEDIENDRDQIWAEALHIYRTGEAWWMQDEDQEAVVAEQDRRTDRDIWVGMLARELQGRSLFREEEAVQALKIRTQDVGWVQTARIARAMNRLGWERTVAQDEVVYVKPGVKKTKADLLDGSDW